MQACAYVELGLLPPEMGNLVRPQRPVKQKRFQWIERVSPLTAGTAGSDPTGSFAMERTRGFGSDGFLRNGKDPRVRVGRVLRKSAELRVRFGS